MADIQDVLAAERNADDIGRLLVQYQEQFGQFDSDEDRPAPAPMEVAGELAQILTLGFQLVAAEIRAHGVRADYVARDEGRRRGHG